MAWCAQAFRFPEREWLEGVRDPALGERLRNAFRRMNRLEALEGHIRALESALERQRASPPLEWESLYIRLFDADRDKPPLYPYARLYRDDQPANPVAGFTRLQELYRRAGLELKLDAGADQPDHLAVELEFTAYLCGRTAESIAAGEDAEPWRNLLDDMLAELRWIEAFSRKLDARPDAGSYAPIAKIAAEVVAGLAE